MSKQDVWVGGAHVVSQLLTQRPQLIKRIVLEKGVEKRFTEIKDLANTHHIPLDIGAPKSLDKSLKDINHQGVGAQIKPTPAMSEGDLLEHLKEQTNPLVLVLDEVQDPHNVGAILRSACAFGVQAVVAPVKNACPMTPTVRKVASGGDLMVPYVQVTNLARWIESMQSIGLWVIGTTLDEQAKPIQEHDLKGPIAIVMGSEGKGLRHKTLSLCDFTAFIPMTPMMESLNVSVACGITLYETFRQRNR